MENTGKITTKFNVQLEWEKERVRLMAGVEADALKTELYTSIAGPRSTTAFDGPDWIESEPRYRVFDLNNGNRPLQFSLDSAGSKYVQVNFAPDFRARSVATTKSFGNDESLPKEDGRWCRAHVANINVHVGRSVLQRLYVIGLVEM